MKKVIRQELPWLLGYAVWFWVLPLLFTGDRLSLEVAYLMLLIGNPFFCTITSVLYGVKYGRKWEFLVYPVIGWTLSMLLYYGSTAITFGLIAWCCAVVGLLLGGWVRNRRMSDADKWAEAHADEDEPKVQSAPAAEAEPISGARVASKTAAKNQQKAAARKAKERAEKEQKLRGKNAPAKKKSRGH
jgi:hypothetical protein